VGDERHDIDGSPPTDSGAVRFGLRRLVARNRGLEVGYRILVALVGFAIVITGLALIPLPGPGWLIVFGGLAVLSTEFVWAERLLNFARGKVRGWTEWVTGQSLAVRSLISLLGLAVVAAAVTVYVKVEGIPSWVPGIG